MSTLHIGDRVTIVGHSMRLAGRTGVIDSKHENGKLTVAFEDGGIYSFNPCDLEKIPASIEKID